MNYFAHGRLFVEDPYFLAGTALPDWLGVVDRRVRVRSKNASPFLQSNDPWVASVAAGVVQHCRDDDWFHQTRAFAELSLELCGMLRDRLRADESFRPHFVGHVLVEILLDAALIEDDPPRLQAYYGALESIDGRKVQDAVRAMTGRDCADLNAFIGHFSRERFLSDYADDGKLLFRLNQVMRRVGLGVLPWETIELLAEARPIVAARRNELLAVKGPMESLLS